MRIEARGEDGAALAELRVAASPLPRDAGEAQVRDAVQSWLETEAQRPANVEADDWLSFEQAKHQKLLAVA